jgi:hypothetical protein
MTEEDVFAGAFGPEDQEAQAQPEPAPEPTPQAQPEPTPEPEAQPEPTPQEPAAAEPEPQGGAFIPLAAHLSERDKRQAAEQAAAQYKAQVDRYEAAQRASAQPVEVPDPYEDPEGYQAFSDQRMQQALRAQAMQFSRQVAEIRHTPEVVQQAHQWAFEKCETDRVFNQQVAASADPYGFAVSEWKKEQVLSQIGDADLTQFQAWKAAQAQAQAQSPSPSGAPVPTPAVRPPQSLATAPSAGGLGVIADEDPFTAEFRKKG